jgi:hypothetical protein
MIIKEFYRKRNDGVNLYRTYSNDNKYIRKIGTDEIYSEAIDIEDSFYNYEETDIPLSEDDSILEEENRTAI